MVHHNEAQTAMDTMEILRELPWEMTRDLAGGMHWIDAYNDTGQRTDGLLAKVRKTPGWPRIWANFSLL